MAEFLSQDEIDALLDIADTDDESDDAIVTTNVKLLQSPFANKYDYVDIKIGNAGFLIREDCYGLSYDRMKIEYYKIIHLTDDNTYIIIINDKLEPIVCTVSDLKGRFYNTREPFNYMLYKDTYDKINELTDEAGFTIADFFKQIEKLKNEYPQEWI